MPSPDASDRYRWVILVLGIVVILGSLGFGRFGFTMILPGMKRGLQLSDIQAGLLVTFSALGYLLLSFFCGFLVRKFGFRAVITWFLALAGVSALCLGLSRSIWTALAASFFLGVGSAGSNIPTMSLLTVWFTRKRRGMAVGISTSGSSFGLLICGLVIPFFYRLRGSEDGWSFSWYFLAACIVGITLVAGLFLRNAPETEKPKQHIQLIQVYRVPVVWHLASIYAMFGISYIIYASFFASYLVDEIGFSIRDAGLLWSAVGIVSIVSGYIWGAVSDRAGRKYALALVFLLQCSCYLVFGIWRAPPGAYISAAFFATTSWSIPAVMAASVGDLFESRLAPVVFGFITVFFGIGQVAGPIVAGIIANASGSYAYSFIGAAICAGLGAGGSLFLRGELKPISSL